MVDYLACSRAALGRRLARTRRPRHAHRQRLQSSRVDRRGRIGLYHRKMYVGPVNRGKEVVVQFDAETAERAISDAGGVELCRRKPDQFNEASLRRLPIG